MWECRRLLARFPRGSWKGWEACLWLSTLSTAPAFPPLALLAAGTRRGDFRRKPARRVTTYCGPASFFFLLVFSR
jgi:hypothetical protein